MNVGTDAVVARIAGKHTEPMPFRFFVSVGTQCDPLPSLVNSVSIGTQSEIAPVDTGAQHVAQASSLAISPIISVPISNLEAARLSDVSQTVEDMLPEEAVVKHDGTEQTSTSEDIAAEYDII